MPKLSIITVCLNNKTELEKTIQSIVGQSFNDFEFIVIDGASTDGSVELIKKYELVITWWVSEKDSGIYNAMNKGIKQARGKYCLFLNSGDCLASEDVLSTVFSKEHDVDIVYGNLICKKGEKKYRITKYPDKLTFYHLYANVASLQHQAAFIKRGLFDKYGLYREDFRIISDWEFFFRAIILNNCSTQHIDLNITVFDSFGISSNKCYSEHDLKTKVLEEYFPQRVLDDYKELVVLKKDFKTKFKTRLSNNKTVYSVARLLYLPYIKLKEYINYLRVGYEKKIE